MRWLALAVALAACREAPAPRSFAVMVHGMQFDPPELHVHPGDTITWSNADIVPHTVTGAGFDGLVDAGASWTLTAPSRGSYPYACKLHPTMQATLIVE